MKCSSSTISTLARYISAAISGVLAARAYFMALAERHRLTYRSLRERIR